MIVIRGLVFIWLFFFLVFAVFGGRENAVGGGGEVSEGDER